MIDGLLNGCMDGLIYPCIWVLIRVVRQICTVNFLNILTPKKFVGITLKFELCGFTIE